MEYVMSSRWSLMERFDITDGSGTPVFEHGQYTGATPGRLVRAG